MRIDIVSWRTVRFTPLLCSISSRSTNISRFTHESIYESTINIYQLKSHLVIYFIEMEYVLLLLLLKYYWNKLLMILLYLIIFISYKNYSRITVESLSNSVSRNWKFWIPYQQQQ